MAEPTASAPTAPTYMVNSAGETVPVAPEQAADAAQLGWVAASPKQIEDAQIQAKYGSTSQAAIAALESAGSAATFGLSTSAERALGVPAEDIAGREQANPTASGLGTVAGIAAPLLAGVGAPEAVADVGGAATRATAAALPEATSALGRVAAKTVATGVGSAVEGAFYGAGQVVHEAALGDPHLTAQSALATIGLSSFIGGALGASGGALSGTLKEFVPSDYAARVRSMLEQSEAHSNLNATNAMPSLIKKTISGKGGNATAIGLAGRDLGILRNPITDSPQAILERAQAVQGEAGQQLDAIAKQASPMIGGEGPSVPWVKLYQDVHEPIVKALRSEGATAGLADEFDRILDRYGEVYSGRNLNVEGLWGLRKDLDSFIYKNGKVLDPWGKALNSPIARVRSHVDQLIEDGIKEGSGSDALAAWKQASRKFEVGATFETLAQSGIERNAANNPIHLSGMMGMLGGATMGDPLSAALAGTAAEAVRRRGASALGLGARALREALAGGEDVAAKTADVIAAERQAGADTVAQQAGSSTQKVAALATLERMNQSIEQRIQSMASALAKGGARVGTVARHEAEAGIPRFFSRGEEAAEAMHSARVADIQRLADPAQLGNALADLTSDMHEHAPNTSEALQIATARAVGFLSAKVPNQPPAGPLAMAPAVSAAEMAKWARYYEAVQHPLDVFKQAANGTLTPEALEAVQMVYPQLFARMRSALTESMRPGIAPYPHVVGMSALMGADLDGSLRLAGKSQGIYARSRTAPAPRPGGAARLTMSQRTLTPMQASAQRR